MVEETSLSPALDADLILARAPDAGAATAARRLANPDAWQNLGRSGDALWGDCRGSALYHVCADLSDLATKCSCPSRKLPCKHSLALLLLAADSPAALPWLAAPPWVPAWVASRRASAARPAKPAAPDRAPQSKRAEKRLALVRQGLDGLDLWLQDLIRTGLAGLDLQKPSFWEKQAARLVDCQAPGLAARVRALALVPGSSPDWPEHLLGELGSLALLIEAFRHVDTLDAAMQADIRSMIGWTLKEKEVAAFGDLTADCWLVLGQWIEDDERLRIRRTWLQGRKSGRAALILQFSAMGAPFGAPLVPGTEFKAALAYWPSSHPLRAFVQERLGPTVPLSARPAGAATIDDFLATSGAALARHPWLDRLPFVLHDAIPVPGSEGPWHVVDTRGEALPLTKGDHWPLLAMSGGFPIDLVGEWHGGVVLPLAVADGTGYLPFRVAP